jgi:DNA replication protein DnaC
MDEQDRDDRVKEARRWLLRALDPVVAVLTAEQMRARIAPSIMATIAKWKPTEGNLLILGDTGVGKTTAAAYIFKRMVLNMAAKSQDGLSDALRVRWFTAMQLGKARRESALGRTVDELERAKRAKILVIDDVGQSSERDDFFEIIDHRYYRSAPTIITSGLQKRQVEARFGAEMWRRFTVNGGKPAWTAEHWGKR